MGVATSQHILCRDIRHGKVGAFDGERDVSRSGLRSFQRAGGSPHALRFPHALGHQARDQKGRRADGGANCESLTLAPGEAHEAQDDALLSVGILHKSHYVLTEDQSLIRLREVEVQYLLLRYY